tara:strand:+ start:463 stop:714 length:252 start_codon:yes stop_codon:yes gene_type:complete
MGILKDILIGGAALKALKQSNRPGVVPPPNCTLLGMEHVGFGRTWKIIYIDNNNPNLKLNFKITPGTTSRTSIGSGSWKFHWS